MNYELLENTVMNSAILLCASIICCLFYTKYKDLRTIMLILFGICIGLTGNLLFSTSSKFDHMYLLDARTVLLSLTGMFLGAIPLCISLIILSIERILLGGTGVITGVLIMIVSASAGLLWHITSKNRVSRGYIFEYLDYFLFAVFTQILSLLCLFTLPIDLAAKMINELAFTSIAIHSITSLLICMVISLTVKRLQYEKIIIGSEDLFRTLYEEAPLGISVDRGQEILFCNPMFEQILGRTKEEVMLHDWRNFTHPDDLQVDLFLNTQFHEGIIDGYSVNKRFYKQDKSIVWVHMVLTTLKTDNSYKATHMCLLQDITENVEDKEKLEQNAKEFKNLFQEYKNKLTLLRTIFDSTNDWIFYKDFYGRYLGCNKAFEKFHGLNEDDLIGKYSSDILTEEVAVLAQEYDKIIMEEKVPVKYEQTHTYPSGKNVILEMLKTPYYNEKGKVQGIICVARDITERKVKEDEIVYLSYHDALTGLYNRVFFQIESARLLASQNNLPLSVIIGDINGLKLINDAFGHDKGDELLIGAANVFRDCLRITDIICRIGGDEFAILLPNTSEYETGLLFNKINSKFSKEAAKKNNVLNYTSISIGYATKTDDDNSLSNVIKAAEDVMYRRKLLSRKGTHSAVLTYIKTSLHEKSNETQQHCERMVVLAESLGQALELKQSELDTLELATNLHDIGKLSIDLSILAKPDKLDEKEWEAIKTHPEVGSRIAQAIPDLQPVSEIILSHHERWDGKGYPRGLAGEEIPLLARIVTLVDSYDAMTEDRVYRKSLSKEEAISQILDLAGQQFDPKIAEIFVNQVLNAKDI